MVVDWDIFADLLDVALLTELHYQVSSARAEIVMWVSTIGHSTAMADLDRLAFE